MVTTNKNIDITEVRKLLGEVHDPEVPVLTILDLGIVRDIRVEGGLEIVITPTYSGCPAMDMIRQQIVTTLDQHGYGQVKVTTVLSPAWTTEWMSQEGKDKLKAYGIAPPNPLQQVCQIRPFHREEAVQCPHCGSYHTSLISEFGSTACKSLYKCMDCKEPFDYFKCH
ncbi:MAG: phenylacetate-CoA oxygenase subunit PaaJ [Sphingobacteriales bacterium 50-39]|nr:phenylacetate-CoA oxygenase subunit PaaJ [Sphingobacteriales bacterium]OJW57518.1 MAG: phenylacetate-CoA oxygenase subunit PaaJ [Sphingobacteriales bacterium 50-39]